jgi:SNF2 family DNA or RNA helicase
MGLGKTLQVLAFLLSCKGDPRPSLVVAPTSLVYNWQEEAARFTPDLRVLVVAGQPGERQAALNDPEPVDVIITSYGLLKRDIELYEQMNLKYCFLDEAQNVKNPQTLNAQAVKRIQADACFALTGTPIENSLTELWSIFDFILPGYFRSHASYVKRFEAPIAKQADSKALQELGRQIRPFVLRRMKQTVLKELPEKIESRLTAPMTPEQARIYAAWLLKARQEFEQEVDEHGFDKSRIKILAILTRLRQLCCHPSLFIENYTGGSGKMELLVDVVRDAVAANHRLLIFSQFTGLLALIKPMLDSLQVSWHYLDGSTSSQERMHLVNSFNRGDKDVFLISLKAGGAGLNLTGADMVVHCDPWWNPAVEDQATDRAYRIGQKNVVQVFKLVAKGTIEEKILMMQEHKRALIDSLIQPGESFIGKMTEAEIRDLFELKP